MLTLYKKEFKINLIICIRVISLKILQKGFNYSQDGPGNRLVYHLQGCNFLCKWCSNADSIPLENIKASDYSTDEILDEILRSRMMFFDGGGVTFTGGEACVQSEELLELLKKIKSNGIHTAIETNASYLSLREISGYVDYLITDFKHYDDCEHQKWTGVSNKSVKENIEYLLKTRNQLHIRIPVIGGVNDNPVGFAEYFAKLDTSEAVFEFLAYHEYGKDKWNGKYEIENAFVSSETIEEFKNEFEKHGMKIVVT